jgi:hypothetical protein
MLENTLDSDHNKRIDLIELFKGDNLFNNPYLLFIFKTIQGDLEKA